MKDNDFKTSICPFCKKTLTIFKTTTLNGYVTFKRYCGCPTIASSSDPYVHDPSICNWCPDETKKNKKVGDTGRCQECLDRKKLETNK